MCENYLHRGSLNALQGCILRILARGYITLALTLFLSLLHLIFILPSALSLTSSISLIFNHFQQTFPEIRPDNGDLDMRGMIVRSNQAMHIADFE